MTGTQALFRIARVDIDEAMEYAKIGPDAFTQIYGAPNRLPGWCVRLAPNEIACFGAELVIAVAQRKAIEAVESSRDVGNNRLQTILSNSDARDNTVAVSAMLRKAEVHPDPETALLLIVSFPGYTVVDTVEEANL